VLYEMLAGDLPFKGDYEQAIVYTILNEEPKSLENIPIELQNAIIKLLTKNPDKRYQEVKSILGDLERIKILSGTEKSKSNSGFKRFSRNTLAYLSAGITFIMVLIIFLKIILFPGKSLPTYHSIAVLPFKNYSPNQENEYFCDGITEDIIAQLSKIAELKVISRTSIMQYKTVNKSLPEIAEELS
jgi:serine/threonine protein kinase